MGATMLAGVKADQIRCDVKKLISNRFTQATLSSRLNISTSEMSRRLNEDPLDWDHFKPIIMEVLKTPPPASKSELPQWSEPAFWKERLAAPTPSSWARLAGAALARWSRRRIAIVAGLGLVLLSAGVVASRGSGPRAHGGSPVGVATRSSSVPSPSMPVPAPAPGSSAGSGVEYLGDLPQVGTTTLGVTPVSATTHGLPPEKSLSILCGTRSGSVSYNVDGRDFLHVWVVPGKVNAPGNSATVRFYSNGVLNRIQYKDVGLLPTKGQLIGLGSGAIKLTIECTASRAPYTVTLYKASLTE